MQWFLILNQLTDFAQTVYLTFNTICEQILKTKLIFFIFLFIGGFRFHSAFSVSVSFQFCVSALVKWYPGI